MLPQKVGRFLVYLVLSYHILLYICFITFYENKYLFSRKLMAYLLTDILCLYNLIGYLQSNMSYLQENSFLDQRYPYKL